ncbi:hypothetical protein NQZ68_005882 [Dissostichus eleginoides]|nr:hypothetical protein NQZ68_005882 [Dissostichus eleginoides]
MVSLEEELELSVIHENFEDVSARKAASRRSVEDFKVPAAAPDLEASSKNLTEERDDLKRAVKDYDLEATLKITVSRQNSLTEERDKLKRINLDLEASGKNLTEERDELKRAVKDYDLEASGKNLTEERDELKRAVKDYDLEASGKNLTEERDELKRAVKDYDLEAKLKITVSQQNSLTEERDKLKRINLDLEASCNNLTEERDELKRAVKDYDLEAKLKMTVSQQNSLTEERDKLKRINLDMVATNTNLAKERDDLGRTLSAGGWKYFSGSLYTISSIAKTWQESRDDCLQKGADLVIINSQEEQDYIASFPKKVWIGLTDRETEGRWKWVDGTPLTTSYWSTGEPNGSSMLDEDCAEIFYEDIGVQKSLRVEHLKTVGI